MVATNTAVTTVTATSAFNAATDTDTDTATVTADAVIAVTKSASVITGPIGTVIEYTLTYTNTGNNTATNVTITDAIPQGVGTGGLKYIAGTGVWSGTVAALTDLNAENQSGITYEVTGTDLAGDRTLLLQLHQTYRVLLSSKCVLMTRLLV